MSSTNPHAAALQRILAANRPPRPWRDGRQLPWHESEFSRRMLSVHLDPSTNMASRRPDIVRRHVDWLVTQLAAVKADSASANVLDLGCGPGLYCHELARRGHRAAGVDVAPAPLAWARERSGDESLDCHFLVADLYDLPTDLARRTGGPFDAITFWFGEFHSFPPAVVATFLPQLTACLKPGGLFVLEYQPWDSFVQENSSSWSLRQESPFCDEPHLWLEEFAWDPETRAEIHVHWILAIESGNLLPYAQCHQAWADDELIALLERHGLGDVAFHPPITGVDERFEFPLLVARRTATQANHPSEEPDRA